ncbi:MAG TPA: Amuc_1100 family pilus-like protein [Candidatus Acidoferrum sp.]|nr:Amuc_1100 family pilus-like protein [Candidatus Acidoferrum sp.]
MKWFQQNRALVTFLVIPGVCILLGAGLLYWRWSVWHDAKQTFDQATVERNRLLQLDPFPNDANYRKLEGYLQKYNAALDKFKEELKAEVAPEPPLAPNEFQTRLRQATLAAQARARATNVKLPDNFQLGFDEFARTMPDTAVAPLLGQELSQVQMLINVLLDAKVDSITALRRQPLSQERRASATPTPTRSTIRGAKPSGTPAPTLIERNVVEVTFKAPPSAVRKVVNEITSSTGQFFIIRALYVHNEKDKGPPRERATASAPTESPQPSPGQSPAGALNFIVGNEHVEVSATIEMLRFTF